MTPSAAPSLAAKVAFLRRPDSYPEAPAEVRAIETHMSWLFLTEQRAYKLKKPFRRNGIDYSTPAMRRLNCRRELRLNRRLAADVYLDVLALTVNAAGQLALGGRDCRVDWLVRMRRLPGELTLERALETGTLQAADMRRIVARLVPFFAAAPPVAMAPAGYRRRLGNSVLLAAAQLRRAEFGLDAAAITALAADLETFGGEHAGLIAARGARVVEGHGDLRPEHIYLTTPPTIIDCIEFDRDLRLHDPVDELSFLAMECERCGHAQAQQWLFEAYRELSDDRPPAALVDYYKAHNAFRRARIAIWHLEDPDTGPREQWIRRAEQYLAGARRHLEQARRAG
jgi:aminoglycoside phosphotransferase family enzyme